MVRLLLILLLGVAQCAGSAVASSFVPAKASYDFQVRVSARFGAVGTARDYYLSSESIIVVFWFTYGPADAPKAEIFKRALSNEERMWWRSYLNAFPLGKLKDTYADPKVHDGYERIFTFRNGSADREVAVRNVQVRELAELSAKIEALVPDFAKMRAGSPWIER